MNAPTNNPNAKGLSASPAAPPPLEIEALKAHEGAVTMVSHGSVFFCNRSFNALLRAMEGQIIGSPIAHHVAAEDRSLFEELLERGAAGKAAGEVRLLAADGTRVPVHLALNALSLEDGQGVCIFVTDLTQHRRSEEMLVQERLTQAILAQATEALVVCDTQDVIIRASDRARQLAGRVLIGVPFASAFPLLWAPGDAQHPAPGQGGPSSLDALCAGLQNVRREATYRRDGQSFHLLVSVGPLRGDGGESFGHVVKLADIRDRRRREAEIETLNANLRQRVEEFETLFRAAPLAIAVAEDPECRRIRVNPFLQDLMGLAPEANASLDAPPEERPPLRFFRDGRELQAAELPQQQVRATGKAVTNVELDMMRADGRMSTLLGHALPLFDSEGRMRGNVAFYVDITQRKRMERALTQSDRHKDEFIATLAHELRNPLAPIRNATELLRTTAAVAPESRQALDMIERHVKQLTRLVDDLLDVSRISEGKIILRKEPLHLADIVARAAEAASPLIDGRSHRLEVSLPPKPVWVNGDESRMTQILVNLLNNAAKYMDPGGVIRLAADVQAGRLALRVSDQGAGIPPEMLCRVFDLFAQGDGAHHCGDSGLGIGLTVVKKMVDLHGGSVEAHSAGLGTGSEFIVYLPTIAPPEPAAPAMAVNRAPSRPLRILVVDDNVDSAETMAMLLQFQGHQLETANSGPTAVETALRFRPDVVLLDIGLPGMDGYEVAQRLRAMPETQAAVLVALTGYGQPRDRQRSQDAGFDHHLVKPVEPESVNLILASVSATQP